MIRYALIVFALLLVAFVPFSIQRSGLKVGSKKFTESVILGEVLAHLSRDAGLPATHYQELGGTKLVFEALLKGDIDIYPEYSGTIREEILAGQEIEDEDQLRRILREQGILMSRPLGFNNSYALGMKRERADELGLNAVSDLTRHPDLRFGFGSEFMDREDGWPKLRQHYGLSPRDVKGMDHDLAYRRLDAGAIDVIDVYTTDAKIEVFDMAVLADDLKYFPRYDALLLYRADLVDRYPDVTQALLTIEGQFDDATMTQMNARAESSGDQQTRVSESRIAADFLADRLNVHVKVKEETR